MPAWLDKARQTLAGQTPRTPEPFEKTCICGGSVAGLRSEQPQQIRCSRCRREWFILPFDVYPIPRSKTRKSKSTVLDRMKRRFAPPMSAGNSSPDEKPADRSNGKTRSGTAAARPPVKEVPLSELLAGWVRHHATAVRSSVTATIRRRMLAIRRAARPVRLIAAGILLCVIATGFFLWQRARQDQAAALLTKLVPQAEASVEAGDLATAAQRYAQAAEAVGRVGEIDPVGEWVLQRNRETRAATNLASQTPFDLAAEFETLGGKPDRWARQFDLLYADRYVVIDAPLRVVTLQAPAPVQGSDSDDTDSDNADSDNADSDNADSDNAEGDDQSPAEDRKPAAAPTTSPSLPPRKPSLPPRKMVQSVLPLSADGREVLFEMDAATLGALAQDSPRMILAARYERCRPETRNGRPVLVVKLTEPFVWASAEVLALTGYDPNDASVAKPAREILDHQTKQLGLQAAYDPAQSAKSGAVK